jgi:hypothetical protein
MNEEREKIKDDLGLVRKCLMFKWTPILHRGGKDGGPDDCFLCKKYYLKGDAVNCCKGCPIFEKTKMHYCNNTPYEQWEDYMEGQGDNRLADDKMSAQLAVDEINFLLRLERDLQKKLNRRVGKLHLEKLPKKWKEI